LIRRGLEPQDFSMMIPLLPATLPRSLMEATSQVARAWIVGPLSTTQMISASVAT
jgi:hypothetical protein